MSATQQVIDNEDLQTAGGNGLVCFTNCLLAQEDGSLIQRDLWIDERRGVILDSLVCLFCLYYSFILLDYFHVNSRAL